MESYNTNLMTIKEDAEQLQKNLAALFREASSYKDATKSMLGVSDGLTKATDRLVALSEKVSVITDVLGKLDYQVFDEIKTDTELIMDKSSEIKSILLDVKAELGSISNRLEDLKKEQSLYKDVISEKIDASKRELIEAGIKLRNSVIITVGIAFIVLLIVTFLE